MAVEQASRVRARHVAENGRVRRVCFDLAKSSALSSLELLTEVRHNDIAPDRPLYFSNEVASVLELLPANLSRMLTKYAADLNEIELDEGKAVIAWVGQDRIVLPNVIVQRDDLVAVANKVGRFGPDNRATPPCLCDTLA
jgi:hypothetical protein